MCSGKCSAAAHQTASTAVQLSKVHAQLRFCKASNASVEPAIRFGLEPRPSAIKQPRRSGPSITSHAAGKRHESWHA